MFLSSRNIVYAAEDKARAITIHMQGLSDEAYYVDLLKITNKTYKNTAEKVSAVFYYANFYILQPSAVNSFPCKLTI